MPRPAFLAVILIVVLTQCGESDLRNVRHERTRDADGIIQLYGNERQGNWTLKGKVILVQSAIVTGIATKSGRVIVDLAGFDTQSPLAIRCTFHKSQTRRVRVLKPGDIISFKALCDGVDQIVVFSSGILIGVERSIGWQAPKLSPAA